MKRILFGLAMCALIAAPVAANVTNGGFETGDLTGWTPSGYVSVVTSAAGLGGYPASDWLPTEGNFFAYLTSGQGMGVYTLMSQSFSVAANTNLSFDVFFDAGDYLPFDDTGYAKLVDTGGGSVTLYQQSVSSVGDYGYNGWTAVTHNISTAGTYHIEFGVVNIADNSLNSALGVDNVVVGGVVPVPGAILLGGIGVSLVGWLRRKRTL